MQVLEKCGVKGVWEVTNRPIQRLTYYAPDGRELPNLPADAYHLERYLKRGFTLQKPQVSETSPIMEIKGVFKCETCGKTFGTRIALEGHKHSHKTEKEVN